MARVCSSVLLLLLLAVLPAFGEETEIARHLEAARQAERVRNYAAASREYQEILELRPELPLIHQSLAVTYHLQNRYPEAIREFQQALKQDPTLWGSWLFLGMDYYKSNEFTLAIPPLEKSITLNAKTAEPEARYWLGSAYAALDRSEDAVKEFRRDLALRPKDVDVLYSLALAYDQCAGDAFARLGRVDPNSADVSILQAERFLEENRQDLAKLEYRRAIAARPDFAGWIPSLAGETTSPAGDKTTPSSADAHANRELAVIKAGGDSDAIHGLEMVRLGRFRDARPLLTAAVKKNPNPYLWLALIRCESETGDLLLAESELRSILASEPKNVDALHLLGHNYKLEAASALQQMIEIDGDSYGVHELLGRQHEEHTEFDLAIREYKLALAKRPNAGGVRYAIGNVYRKMSRYEEAQQWLAEELKRNPYHGLAQYRLGSVLLAEGKPAEAIPHLEVALRAHPRLTDARMELGRAFTAAGKYAEAVEALKMVASQEPENDRVHYLLAAAYSKEGLRDKANAELAAYQQLTRSRLQHTQRDIQDLSNSLNQQ